MHTLTSEHLTQDHIDTLVDLVLQEKPRTPKELLELKKVTASRFGEGYVDNVNILNGYKDRLSKDPSVLDVALEKLLQRERVRSLSGITAVAILTKPFGCPGKCVYCPTEENMPKSYLSTQPAAARAVRNEFDPKRQVLSRIKQLEATGHSADKIEIIVMGGTFNALPRWYQEKFILGMYEAMNGDSSATIEEAQEKNRRAKYRCVGLTLETRPDWVNEEEVKRFKWLGATRIEIGVQSVYDDVLELVNRGHDVARTKEAMRLLKDAGFKVNFHMMPNLPGSTIERDIDMFRILFEDPDFRPDMLKIYPCVATRDTKLIEWFEDGRYTPYSDPELVDLLLAAKRFVPEYVRLMRLIRDIPAEDIVYGSKASNLRQMVASKAREVGFSCKCIRCREIRDLKVDEKDIELVVREYDASGGKELFISYEDTCQDKLIALLRLRIPSSTYIDVLEDSLLLRELHTYGVAVPIDQTPGKEAQHKGYGKKLLAKAEEVAREYNLKKIACISGIGVQPYYEKYGYYEKDGYMIKDLD